MRSRTVNLLLVLAAAAVFGVALMIGTSHGDFVGTDSQANDEITQSDPGYEPWFSRSWTQPGGEVESGLFALQAALGAGVLGFALGSLRERRRSSVALVHLDGPVDGAVDEPRL